MSNALVKTDFNFPGQKSVYKGKVRDVYTLEGDLLVMVASDRISAFDHILPKGIPFKGQVFACHPNTSVAVIEAVRRNIGGELPIIAKLSPDVTDIVEIAAAVINAGVDGLALINTLLGMVIDTNSMKPKLAGKTGGLSGPAIRPVAVRAIYQVHQAFPNTPIVGMGGVASGRDAFELILAGASAVSIGTASFGNPNAAMLVKSQLSDLLIERGFIDFRDAIGFAHRGL